LVESKGAGQKKIQVAKLEILEIQMQRNSHKPKNKPSLDYLRENAHLRVRTNMFGAIMRASGLSFAVHSYFQKKVLCM
jgi:asparaginyl-tRNA synthetase